MARAARLLSLLQILRRRTRPVTAAVLGVSERTVYRDVVELTTQGASISGATTRRGSPRPSSSPSTSPSAGSG